jgi:thioredoxin
VGVNGKQVDQNTFARDVLERSHELPVVVDFWAAWCGPCRILAPALEQAIAERSASVELAKVDVDANPELAAEYAIRGIPAVKAFRRGRVVAEFVGARPPASIAAFLDELTGPSALERLIAELRASGDLPEVREALEEGDHERALQLMLDEVVGGDPAHRDRIRTIMVTLFGELGHEEPVTVRYRRRLASALY